MDKGTIVFDFDGVIHSYTTPWQAASVIPDKPIEGIKEVIDKLRENGYGVTVQTTRALAQSGKQAVEKYLQENDIVVDSVTAQKVPALVYIDDRGMNFNGKVDGLYEAITSFQTYQEIAKVESAKAAINNV